MSECVSRLPSRTRLESGGSLLTPVGRREALIVYCTLRFALNVPSPKEPKTALPFIVSPSTTPV